ncbi:MAG: hypothetical protein ABSE85_16635 [Candidatus Korobacteraceae bacterium]
MATDAQKRKKPIVVFDATRHRLEYKFEYNPEETKALRKLMSGNESVTISDLRRVALWKLDRVLSVPESVLQRLQKLVNTKLLRIDSCESKKILSELVACSGVGFPMASAFLKFLRPDVFPIIDVRAYRALFGRKLSSASYKLDLYLEYAAKVEELAKSTGLQLHEVDEQLYRFDQEHNGGIDS